MFKHIAVYLNRLSITRDAVIYVHVIPSVIVLIVHLSFPHLHRDQFIVFEEEKCERRTTQQKKIPSEFPYHSSRLSSPSLRLHLRFSSFPICLANSILDV